jgi:regulatory protein
MELRTKLLRAARSSAANPEPEAMDPTPAVEALLDELQAQGLLCEARFTESRVHLRSARFGNRRILQELQQHGIRPDAETTEALRATEWERAQSVWSKKFGQPPTTPAEYARHTRFLAGRGFSADTIRRVLRQGEG